MPSPLVSIVVPCFNGAAFLPTCVQSVMRQDCEVEVIIVDDGSTDESPTTARDLCLAHPSRVITIIQANQGQAAARNAGIRTASGMFIGFLDVDDEYAPGFLRRASDVLAEHANVVAVQGKIEFINRHRLIEPWQQDAMESTAPGNILARLEMVRQIGGFPVDPAFRGPVAGEDGSFRRQLALCGAIAQIDQPALHYRVHPGSHFDYFLDRAVLKDGRISFTELSPQEADGSLNAAIDNYREQVAVNMIARLSQTIESDITAGANLVALQQAFGRVQGTTTPAEGFALYTLARRWPVAGVSLLIGGDGGRASCWLAAGCKSSGAGKLTVLDPVEFLVSESPSTPSTARERGSLEAVLEPLGLSPVVDVLETCATEAAKTWSSRIRLISLTVMPGLDAKSHFETWSALLARHGLLIIHGNQTDTGYRQLCAELSGNRQRWKPIRGVPTMAVFENLATPARDSIRKSDT